MAAEDDGGVTLAHAVPGRTRLRVGWLPAARRRDDRAAVSALGDAVARIGGVREVEIRAATASVLCRHDETLAASDLMAAVEAAAAAHAPAVDPASTEAVRESGSPRAKIAREMTALLREANERLLAVTEGRLDLGTLASLGLFGASAIHVALEQRLTFPRWSDLAWWATQTFASFEQPDGNR